MNEMTICLVQEAASHDRRQFMPLIQSPFTLAREGMSHFCPKIS